MVLRADISVAMLRTVEKAPSKCFHDSTIRVRLSVRRGRRQDRIAEEAQTSRGRAEDGYS